MGVAGILAAWLMGEKILTLIYKPEYAQQHKIFLLLMIAASISYLTSCLGYTMTAAQYFRAQIPVLLATLVSSIVCSAFFIPLYGLWGAALGMIITNMVSNLGFVIILIFALKYNKALPEKKI